MRALTLVAVFCVLASACAQSHDLSFGHISYGDVTLFKINDYRYGFPLFIRRNTVEYPAPGQVNFAFIKAIYIKDHYNDGSGGYASISAGGIDQRFVKIKLKSQRGNGYNFTITIYGRY